MSSFQQSGSCSRCPPGGGAERVRVTTQLTRGGFGIHTQLCAAPAASAESRFSLCEGWPRWLKEAGRHGMQGSLRHPEKRCYLPGHRVFTLPRDPSSDASYQSCENHKSKKRTSSRSQKSQRGQKAVAVRFGCWMEAPSVIRRERLLRRAASVSLRGSLLVLSHFLICNVWVLIRASCGYREGREVR